MARIQRHATLTEGALEPTWSPGDVSRTTQRELMRELRGLSNSIAGAFHARDERLHALALSGALSRRDMATATGLAKSRIDQIIREMAEAENARKTAAAMDRVRRHLPAA